MLLERITTWLNSPDDYLLGLDLLRESGYRGFTLSVLEKGANAYNQTRLESELRKWVGSPNNVSDITPPALPGPVDNSATTPSTPQPILRSAAAAGSGTEQSTAEPAAVTQLRQRKYDLLDERKVHKARLSVKLNDGNSDELMAERLPQAMRIKGITRELDEIQSQLDFFAQHGYLPPSAADPAIDLDDRAKLLTVRTYVSRYKGKLNKKGGTLEQRQSWSTLLTQYTEEKNRLELKLSKQNDLNPTGQQTTNCPNDS